MEGRNREGWRIRALGWPAEKDPTAVPGPRRQSTANRALPEMPHRADFNILGFRLKLHAIDDFAILKCVCCWDVSELCDLFSVVISFDVISS